VGADEGRPSVQATRAPRSQPGGRVGAPGRRWVPPGAVRAPRGQARRLHPRAAAGHCRASPAASARHIEL